jgi:hypothetical protein
MSLLRSWPFIYVASYKDAAPNGADRVWASVSYKDFAPTELAIGFRESGTSMYAFQYQIEICG